MTKRAILAVVVALAVVGVGLYVRSLHSQLTTLRGDGKQAAAPAAKTPSAPRTLSDDQRQAMLEVLRSENGATRKVWFQVERNRSESVAFHKALEQVFRDAGWEVQTAGVVGMTLKPGVYLLVAEEDWPPNASTAYEALQKAGIDVKAASGYRSYYEQQTAEKPGWTGPKLGPDQTYVVLIGANPST